MSDGGSTGAPVPGGLRAAFGGLTTRGRSFLAAGVAAAACAYLLGQADLLRVGLLLAALPLVCVLVLHRTRYRVVGSRTLAPARVPAAAEARVGLRVENVARLSTGVLMLQDRVPYVLGPRPRFVLDRVEPGGHREVSYRVRSDLRGRYPLGPLQLRLSDPFGMCELTRSFSTSDTLTVVPRVEPLPPVRLAGEAAGYGDGRHRSLALAGEDDVIPRGYRHGDDLRRVHWRSTARHGELMVRREEQPEKARCTILLDTRAAAHHGSGPDSAFEWAVAGAASVALHLLERGFSVRLLTDTGSAVPGPEGGGFTGGGESADSGGLLLETLAVVEHSGEEDLSAAYDVLRGGTEGLLIAFFGELDEEQAALAGRLCRGSAAAVAFVMDGDAWTRAPGGFRFSSGAAPVDDRLRMLREAGWTALPVRPGDALADLWRAADRAGVAPAGASAGAERGDQRGDQRGAPERSGAGA
ncbi:DUF58 domain-containing protein [Streptomyces noursei]|uniref:Membrane protein n=1 Tax=Streptomyces noursei TaxID=1971 RepID=A0A401QZC3_STRNR|nr:DUF58 domain-containing protein [Streptomyces noursei]EOT06115.1 membrane protein [Streptomyces noursei CCRC 11814]EXU88466.1 membrane protein [Streptomyces noursei PD-1]UWS71856.1 DUF58 domain-containing protein [Streptomyces noursei]GCB90723.1 membrane protein [Streptomyces noursei]